MKIISLLLTLCFQIVISSSVLSQQDIIKIINKKTPQHVALPGYDIYLTIPSGFSLAPHFSGWHDAQGSMILVKKSTQSVKGSMEMIEKKLLADNYSYLAKTIMINNRNGVFIEANNNEKSIRKNMLILESAGFVYIVECKELSANHKLKDVLFTLYFEN